MTSLSHIDVHPRSNYVPLSDAEGGAINELLVLGCKLYYQKGKERVYHLLEFPDSIMQVLEWHLCYYVNKWEVFIYVNKW